jgi:flagellin-specific chaperone FliS
MMKRTSLNVFPSVKRNVKDIQRKLNVSNESEVVDYLTAFYTLFFEKLTVAQHERLLEKVRDSHEQVSLD